MYGTSARHRAAVCGVLLAAVAGVAGADGVLDTTFGALGRFIGTPPGSYSQPIGGVLVQPDGRILIGTSASASGLSCNGGFTLTRLAKDAAGVDLSFGSSGYMHYCFTSQMPSGYVDNGSLRAVVPTGNGGALLGGFVALCSAGGCGKTDVALLRVDAAGVPDPAFNGGAGVVIGSGATYGDSLYRSASAVAVAGNGTVIATGPAAPSFSMSNLALWAVGANGVLLREYVEFGSNNAQPLALALQPDGKILVAGWVEKNNATTSPPLVDKDCVIARYVLQGTSIARDASFGVDGRVRFAFDLGGVASGTSYNDDLCTSVTAQPDGRIVFAGWSNTGVDGTRAFTGRLLPDGQLDPAFLSGNVRRFYFENGFNNSVNTPTQVLVQSDGRIVVVGHGSTAIGSGRASDMGVTRFLPDGAFDYGGFGGTTPGSTGARSMIDFSALTGTTSSDQAYAAVLDAGRVVVAGGEATYRVARLDADRIFRSVFE